MKVILRSPRLALLMLGAAVSAIAVAAFLLVPRPEAEIRHVTSLADSGPGTLRECAEGRGRRACVFDVSGDIELSGSISLADPFVTIAGETAPSPGITLRGAGLRIRTHDVSVRHIRIRVGDAAAGDDPSDRDGIQIKGKGRIGDILIDHVSVSWAVDENIDIWGENVAGVTIRDSIVSEGLDDSIHPEGRHSMGLLLGSDGSFPERISVTGSLFAHNASRNPRAGNVHFSGNVVYDWETPALITQASSTEPIVADLSGNIYKAGPGTGQYSWPIAVYGSIPRSSSDSIRDNRFLGRTESLGGDQEAFDRILEQAGARPSERDAVDERIVREAREGTGSVVDCVTACRTGARQAKGGGALADQQ